MYHTTDLNLAAYLAYEGFKYTLTVEGKIATFVFKNDARLQKCIANFYGQIAMVIPQKYALTIKQLKNHIYNYV